jgi:hypothetical protein
VIANWLAEALHNDQKVHLPFRAVDVQAERENAPATALFAHIKINPDIDVQQQRRKCRPSACACTKCKSN